MRYFVDADGVFLGGFDRGIPAPNGGIQVSSAPEDARQRWTGSEWGAPPVAVPVSVSSYKASRALLRAGLLDDVEAIMADPTTPREMVLAWNRATEFERSSPTVAAIAAALGLSDAEVDALFIDAAAIAE